MAMARCRLPDEDSGKLAYDSGDYTEAISIISTGNKLTLHGSYLMLLKRQTDGKWLILKHAWTGVSAGSQSERSAARVRHARGPVGRSETNRVSFR